MTETASIKSGDTQIDLVYILKKCCCYEKQKKQSDETESCSYSIIISEFDKNGKFIEQSIAKGVTNSDEYGKTLLKILADSTVTPTTLPDIIKDIKYNDNFYLGVFQR